MRGALDTFNSWCYKYCHIGIDGQGYSLVGNTQCLFRIVYFLYRFFKEGTKNQSIAEKITETICNETVSRRNESIFQRSEPMIETLKNMYSIDSICEALKKLYLSWADWYEAKQDYLKVDEYRKKVAELEKDAHPITT